MMRSRGFTFIEAMLVAGIFAAVSVAVFTCLADGLKLWDRGKRLVIEEDVAIFMDRFSSDLRNSFVYSKIPFSGKESQIEFPAIVWVAADRVSVRADEGLVNQIGRVKYAFDPQRSVILRAQANYSQALDGRWGEDAVVVSSVKEFRLYYFYGISKDPHMHADPGKGLPSGVEVHLIIPGHGASEEKVFKRYVAVPAGA